MSDSVVSNTRKPILAAVRAMHEAEDTGIDPYDTARLRALRVTQPTAAQKREADGILACFETTLEVLP